VTLQGRPSGPALLASVPLGLYYLFTKEKKMREILNEFIGERNVKIRCDGKMEWFEYSTTSTEESPTEITEPVEGSLHFSRSIKKGEIITDDAKGLDGLREALSFALFTKEEIDLIISRTETALAKV
jgi:hypothetical protein